MSLVSVWHMLAVAPEPSDYQQYVAGQLDRIDHSRLFVSGYIFLADPYINQSEALVADEIRVQDIPFGSYVLVDDSLKFANPKLYQTITDANVLFVPVLKIPAERIFSSSQGRVETPSPITVYRLQP